MNKQLLSLFAALFVFGGVVAEDTKIEAAKTITLKNETTVTKTVTVEYVNDSFAGKVGRLVHRRHSIEYTVEAGQEVIVNLETKSLRIRKITVKDANGKTSRKFLDNAVELPVTITFTKDGIVTSPVLSFDKNKADKTYWTAQAAVVAAQ